jgi:hypothetical protein
MAARRSRAADQAAWRKSRQAATQARWRARREAGEVVAKVITKPAHRSKLVAAGYLAPSRRNDREAIAAALGVLLDLMEA